VTTLQPDPVAAGSGRNAPPGRLESGSGVPEPGPSAAPLVTGSGTTQGPANVGGGTVFPVSTVAAVDVSCGGPAGFTLGREFTTDDFIGRAGGNRQRGEMMARGANRGAARDAAQPPAPGSAADSGTDSRLAGRHPYESRSWRRSRPAWRRIKGGDDVRRPDPLVSRQESL
jgi:hypothetical protein